MEAILKEQIKTIALYILHTELEDFKEWSKSRDADEKHIYQIASQILSGFEVTEKNSFQRERYSKEGSTVLHLQNYCE